MNQCQAILVVEDDAEIRNSLKDIIELEGYHVFTAPDGQQGLRILRENITTPCLVLLDLMMPVMNGWEFLEVRKNDVLLATIPVIVVSAAGERARQAQASGYIKKPVDIDVLLELIHKHCGPPAAQQARGA